MKRALILASMLCAAAGSANAAPQGTTPALGGDILVRIGRVDVPIPGESDNVTCPSEADPNSGGDWAVICFEMPPESVEASIAKIQGALIAVGWKAAPWPPGMWIERPTEGGGCEVASVRRATPRLEEVFATPSDKDVVAVAYASHRDCQLP